MDENKKEIHQAGKGLILIIIACAVYLIWWFVNYYPDSPYSNFLGNTIGMLIWGGMFLAVFILCLAGGLMIIRSFRHLNTDRSLLKARNLAITCLILSIILPLLISRIRFITLDIFLIIWWPFLELCLTDAMYGSHLMEKKTSQKAFIRVLIYTLISLIIYIFYPFPPVYIRFVLGAVPILMYGAEMSWMALKMKKS